METLKRTLHSNQIHVSIHPEFHRRRLITTLFKAFVVWQQTTCVSTPGGTHKLRGESFITRRFLSLGGTLKLASLKN